MHCCGREVPAIRLNAGGEDFVVHRCGSCDTTLWEKDSEIVDLAAVAAALRDGRRQATAPAARPDHSFVGHLRMWEFRPSGEASRDRWLSSRTRRPEALTSVARVSQEIVRTLGIEARRGFQSYQRSEIRPAGVIHQPERRRREFAAASCSRTRHES